VRRQTAVFDSRTFPDSCPDSFFVYKSTSSVLHCGMLHGRVHNSNFPNPRRCLHSTFLSFLCVRRLHPPYGEVDSSRANITSGSGAATPAKASMKEWEHKLGKLCGHEQGRERRCVHERVRKLRRVSAIVCLHHHPRAVHNIPYIVNGEWETVQACRNALLLRYGVWLAQHQCSSNLAY
jgi:hypothetical protein